MLLELQLLVLETLDLIGELLDPFQALTRLLCTGSQDFVVSCQCLGLSFRIVRLDLEEGLLALEATDRGRVRVEITLQPHAPLQLLLRLAGGTLARHLRRQGSVLLVSQSGAEHKLDDLLVGHAAALAIEVVRGEQAGL